MAIDYVSDPAIFPTITGNCATTTTTTTTTTTQPCIENTLYVSLVSGDDAACNQTVSRSVRLNAASLAAATQVYSTTDCSSLAPANRWYAETFETNYYYWNGVTLTGPFVGQCQ